MEHNWSTIQLTSTDSTNKYLQRIIENNSVTKEIVINARFQSHGKGQEQNRWESDPYQNLTFSILLMPDYIPVNQIFTLNQIISLAIIDFLTKYQIYARIKWPNDIMVGRKKIAGILIETIIMGSKIQYAIVGIGLNVNQELFPLLQNKAISMRTLLGYDLNLDTALQQLLNCIHTRIQLLKEKNFEAINNEYIQLLYLYNTWSNYYKNEKQFMGKIINVKSTGEICIMLNDGQVKEFMNKEISFC